MKQEINNLGRDTNTITISTFYENYLLKKYNFEPPCQRESVWDEDRESFLIDSIMKNFSIPPIFLHQKIDDESGKTVYDVIDGKQRLTSIIKFIENQIALPDDYSDDKFGDERLNGLKFEELNSEDLREYKKRFWRYKIPVEYIDTEDMETVNAVFDRLNRNGIPLSPQELRNAKFNNTHLLKLINELSELKFWRHRFIKTNRMEDKEFISELILVILEGEVFNANPKDIDLLYEKYQNIEQSKANDVKKEFIKITNLLNGLELDYKKYNLSVTHIYAIWCVCLFCYRNDMDILKYKNKLEELYIQYRNKNKSFDNEAIQFYRGSINRGGSKSKWQRRKRVQAILDYCGINLKI